MDETLIIVPTYNERENISPLLQQIFAAVPSVHVLFVDDNSPDHTAQEIKKAALDFPGQVFLEERQQKEGLGKAYLHGFDWALRRQYHFIFEMDADLSHPPSRLPEMITLLKGDVAVVVGSRYLNGVHVVNWPKSRILLSRVASLYVRFMLGLPVKDPTAGFVGYRRSALSALDLSKVSFVGYAFQIEMKFKLWRKGFFIKEIPIVFFNRERGQSKMNSSIIWEAIFGVIYLKFTTIKKQR